MAEILEGTQAQPEGETVANQETATTENLNEHDQNREQHNEAQEGDESGERQQASEEQREEKPKQPKKPLSWEMKRIHEETNKRRELEQKFEEAQKELERLRKGTTSEAPETPQTPDIDTIANQRAQQLVEQREYQKKVNAWDAAGAKEFGREDFNNSCDLIASLMDQKQTYSFMQTITDPEIVEDGHKIVMALAENPEEAERILRLPPVKQALELNKLSAKIKQPTPKPVSKVPPPVDPVKGSPKGGTRLDDPDAPMDKWADDFLKSIRKR